MISILFVSVTGLLLPVLCQTCTTNLDCDTPVEYCESVILDQCRPCRDLCAPQYPDSHRECKELCPDYHLIRSPQATLLDLPTSTPGVFVSIDSTNSQRAESYCRFYIVLSVSVLLNLLMTIIVVVTMRRRNSERRNSPLSKQTEIINKQCKDRWKAVGSNDFQMEMMS